MSLKKVPKFLGYVALAMAFSPTVQANPPAHEMLDAFPCGSLMTVVDLGVFLGRCRQLAVHPDSECLASRSCHHLNESIRRGCVHWRAETSPICQYFGVAPRR